MPSSFLKRLCELGGNILSRLGVSGPFCVAVCGIINISANDIEPIGGIHYPGCLKPGAFRLCPAAGLPRRALPPIGDQVAIYFNPANLAPIQIDAAFETILAIAQLQKLTEKCSDRFAMHASSSSIKSAFSSLIRYNEALFELIYC